MSALASTHSVSTTIVVFLSLHVMSGCSRPNSDRADSSIPSNETVTHPSADSVVRDSRDLGAVLYDESTVVPCSFDVVNNRSTDVCIKDVVSHCGCSMAAIEERDLGAGQKTILRTQTNISAMDSRTVSCSLVLDDGTRWIYQFAVRAYPRVQFDPGVLFFGNVDPFKTVEREVNFVCRSPDLETLRGIDEFKVNSAELEIIASETDNVREPEPNVVELRYKVKVRLGPLETAGPGHGSIVAIRSTEDDQAEKFDLPVQWNVASLFDCEPRRAFFGKVGDDSNRKTLDLRIRRADGLPFKIEAVDLPHSCLEFHGELNESSVVHHLTLELDPKRLPSGALWDKVQVRTDFSKQPNLAIPVAAFRRAENVPDSKGG